MDEAFYGLSIQDVCRVMFEFAEKDCIIFIYFLRILLYIYSIIHLLNKENKMSGLDFVKGFANPANKSKKVALKYSKKLNKPKEKVIATDQEDCLLCTGMYSKEEWVAYLQCKLWFHDDCCTSFAASGTICDLCL